MRILLSLARIHILVWLVVAGLYSFKIHHDFTSGPKEQLEGEIASKAAMVTKLDGDIKRAEDFQTLKDQKFKALQELELRLSQAADKIPRTLDVPSLLKPLADVSDKVGLEFFRFKPGLKFNLEFLSIYPIEVDLKGTYSQVMSFLDEVAHLTRVISSKKLTLDQPQPKGSASLLTAKVLLYVYSMDPNSNLGASSGTSITPAVGTPATPAAGAKK